MIKVGIVGGTGYTGVELLRLLVQHPDVSLEVITSRAEAGVDVAQIFPSLRGRLKLAFSEPNTAALAACDVVFFATPHGVAMQQATALLAAGVKVIDLGADFRLKQKKPHISYGFFIKAKRLTLGELFTLTRFVQTNFFTLNTTRITRNKTCLR